MDAEAAPPVVLESLTLENVRGSERLELVFKPRPRKYGQWTVLLGDNGVGKTTVLLALALRVSSTREHLTNYARGDLRSAGDRDARLDLRFVGGQAGWSGNRYSTDVRHWERLDRVEPVFAYGTRRGDALGGADRGVDLDHPLGPVSTLLDEPPGLVHAETWLRSLELGALKGDEAEKRFVAAVHATLLGVLPGIDRLEVPARGPVLVSEPAVGETPLSTLSDGYLTTLGWVTDLIARWSEWARRRGLSLTGDFAQEMTGLVLVDEIDLHLHPRWQKHVIDDLRKAFPRLSFVVTTHNPLTLHGARKGEIQVLRREGDRVVAKQVDLPEGADADEVLTGPWFGLSTTIDEDTVRAIERYQQQARRTEDPEDLARLERKLLDRLGGTRAHEQVAPEIVQQAPAKLKAFLEDL